MIPSLLIISILFFCFTHAVLSSVGGIKVNQPNVKDGELAHLTFFESQSVSLTQWIFVYFAGLVVGIACIILLLLFSVQRFGTDKVGWFFAPTVFIWLVSIGVIGIYNTIKHDYMVLKAFSPVYIVRYFASDSQRNWVSLGGVLLSITGIILRNNFSQQSLSFLFINPCMTERFHFLQVQKHFMLMWDTFLCCLFRFTMAY